MSTKRTYQPKRIRRIKEHGFLKRMATRAGRSVLVLERRGHVVTRAGDWALGRLSCVVADPDTGVLAAAANPRGAQGYAAGR